MKQHCTQSVNIAAAIKLFTRALLGRHILRRADHRTVNRFFGDSVGRGAVLGMILTLLAACEAPGPTVESIDWPEPAPAGVDGRQLVDHERAVGEAKAALKEPPTTTVSTPVKGSETTAKKRIA